MTTPREPGHYIVDHDNNDRTIRGPFKHAETAVQVRREMEHRGPWSEKGNLWVIEEPGFTAR